MNKAIVVTDLHGCYYTLIRLLNKCPRGARLFFNGDLVDRGPNSRKVVEFAMKNSIPTVMGNHEDLLVDFYHPTRSRCGKFYDRGVWIENGGKDALRNWPAIDSRDANTPSERRRLERDRGLGGRVPDSVIDWIAALPAYIIPDDVSKDPAGRKLLVSHTGYGLRADNGHWFTAIWGRYPIDRTPFAVDLNTGQSVDDGFFRPVGHTFTKEPILRDSYCLFDTGAAYHDRGGGTMTGFIWPDKTFITQEYDESVMKPDFTVGTNGVLT